MNPMLGADLEDAGHVGTAGFLEFGFALGEEDLEAGR